MKEATEMSITRVVLLSRSKHSQLEQPTKGKLWTQALELSQAIVDSVLQMVQVKTFLERSASPKAISQMDHSIAQLCHI